jgi:hypothetical protein
MIPYSEGPHALLVNELIMLPRRQRYGHLNSGISFRLTSLHVSTAPASIVADIVDVDGRANDFYIAEGKLRALCYDPAIYCN